MRGKTGDHVFVKNTFFLTLILLIAIGMRIASLMMIILFCESFELRVVNAALLTTFLYI